MNRFFLVFLLILVFTISGCTQSGSPTTITTLPSSTSWPPINPPVSTETPLAIAVTPLPSDYAYPSPETTYPLPRTAYPLPESPLPSAPPLFELTSAGFEDGQPIPIRHTCHGENLSPPLAWSQLPSGTVSLALIMDDPDAVSVAGIVWDHWVLFNLPGEITSLPEGMPSDAEFPDGTRQGLNSFNQLGYGGPCPPRGQTHTYLFELIALDVLLELPSGASKAGLLEAMKGHVLGQAQLLGLYTSP